MASVYYLLDDALQVGDFIVDKYSQQDENLKEKHHAATVIQRTWRRFKAKAAYTQIVRAAVVFQKHIRAWLVRFHLPERYEEYLDKMALQRYHWAATVIQKYWRGLLVRMELDIKALVEEKLRKGQKDQMRMSFDILSSQTAEDKNQLELAVEGAGLLPGGAEWVQIRAILEVMFDRHHLLSTQTREGVLGANKELQEIEKFLSKLPWKGYMKQMRKMYFEYRRYEKCEERAQYLFEDPRMRRAEDVRRLRDTGKDLKEESLKILRADKRKPFSLHTTKTPPLAHEASVMRDGRYRQPIRNVVRSCDASKNVCGEDFYLSLKEVGDKCDVPPYYIDFWFKECTGHCQK